MSLRTTTIARSAMAALAIVLALASLSPWGAGRRRRLIQWGWDEPNTKTLLDYLPEMEASPFDGCVFGVRYGSGGRGGSFTWEFWGRRAFSVVDVADALADLKRLRPKRFTETFLRINVTPGDVDWSDEFSPVLQNARLAAQLARAGRTRGLLLDVEQYQNPVFDHRRPDRSTATSWDARSGQVRSRGRDLMVAFQAGYPDLTLFLTFGHSLPWVLSDHGRRPLSETPYGLLAPFVDGLLEGAHGATRVVDGYELSYGFRHPDHFMDARCLVEKGVMPIVGAQDAYRRRLQLAFGLWLDYDWRHRGWDPGDDTRNYFTAAVFETAVAQALRSSDEYVWIYAETPRWWGAQDEHTRVPDAYRAAVLRARTNGSPTLPEHDAVRCTDTSLK